MISLATIALEPSTDGKPCPIVREVNAYYEDGTFYVITWGTSDKMLQIAQNAEVAFSVNAGWFNGSAIGENIGWVLNSKNAELRIKLRTAFSEWYDKANNENDEKCRILAINIKKATLNIDHWAKLYDMDFINKICE